MSYVRIYPWKDAPLALRRAFGRRRRQWLAHVPLGCVLAVTIWINRIETTLDDGSTVVGGTNPRWM